MATQLVGRIEGLDTDVAALLAEVKSAITAAMPNIERESEDALKYHVQKDVYDAFEPTRYKRRKENGGLIDTKQSDGVFVTYSDQDSMTLHYNPTGWSDQAAPYWVLNNDALIRRIESAYPPYNWKGEMPGPRPFFTPFVVEMLEGGRAEKALVNGMNAVNAKLGVAADGSVRRDSDDWDG